MKTEIEALREARTVANILGKDWDIRVWNNLAVPVFAGVLPPGWHWALTAQGGCLQLHPRFRSGLTGDIESWTLFVNHKTTGGGQFVGRGDTPREALEDAINEADERLSKAQTHMRLLRAVTV